MIDKLTINTKLGCEYLPFFYAPIGRSGAGFVELALLTFVLVVSGCLRWWLWINWFIFSRQFIRRAAILWILALLRILFDLLLSHVAYYWQVFICRQKAVEDPEILMFPERQVGQIVVHLLFILFTLPDSMSLDWLGCFCALAIGSGRQSSLLAIRFLTPAVVFGCGAVILQISQIADAAIQVRKRRKIEHIQMK